MGMSHAAAVWIPGNTHDASKLESIVRANCEHPAIDFDVATRSAPPATCIVAPLDEREELQMDFELLCRTAAALARELGTPTYALYGFFGSGDFLMINAFDADGAECWTSGSTDEDPRAPYWKMMEEVAPGFTDDVLGLCIKPAFDLCFIDGWKPGRSFVADVPAADSVEALQAELASRSADAFNAVLEQVRVRSFEVVRPVKAKKKKPAGAPKKKAEAKKKKKPVARKKRKKAAPNKR